MVGHALLTSSLAGTHFLRAHVDCGDGAYPAVPRSVHVPYATGKHVPLVGLKLNIRRDIKCPAVELLTRCGYRRHVQAWICPRARVFTFGEPYSDSREELWRRTLLFGTSNAHAGRYIDVIDHWLGRQLWGLDRESGFIAHPHRAGAGDDDARIRYTLYQNTSTADDACGEAQAAGYVSADRLLTHRMANQGPMVADGVDRPAGTFIVQERYLRTYAANAARYWCGVGVSASLRPSCCGHSSRHHEHAPASRVPCPRRQSAAARRRGRAHDVANLRGAGAVVPVARWQRARKVRAAASGGGGEVPMCVQR